MQGETHLVHNVVNVLLPRAAVATTSLESVQGQIAQGLEQGVPTHDRRIGKKLALRSLPTQTVL